jgi:hypothetical protein
VAIVADGDAFTLGSLPINYFDRADNRQFATSVFAYLAVPEPATSVLMLALVAASLTAASLRNRSRRNSLELKT